MDTRTAFQRTNKKHGVVSDLGEGVMTRKMGGGLPGSRACIPSSPFGTGIPRAMAVPEAERSGAEFSPARSADEDELDDSPDVLLARPEWRHRFTRDMTRIPAVVKYEEVGWFNGGDVKGGGAGIMHS